MKTSDMTAFPRLLEIMDELREKCPWDQKQTNETLRRLTLEEVYELVEAISLQDADNVKEELGDLLLHIVFYAKIASEQKQFDINDVIVALCDKLIRRHPHIYGDVKVGSEKDVKENWEKLKLQEGKRSVMQGLPKGLPAIIKAHKIQEKASEIGFDWETARQVWGKVEEEIDELKTAIEKNDELSIQEEFGDLMFTLINYARHLGVDAENSLELSNRKFLRRFERVERLVLRSGRQLLDINPPELNELWEKAKDEI